MDIPAGGRAGYPRPDWDDRSRRQPDLAAGSGRRRAGLPGWLALVVLLAIAGIGGAIDAAVRDGVHGGFNVGLVVASIVAILLVQRRNMLTIVVAPPLVYAAASVALLYIRSSGLNDRKILLDAAVNWLVYGFPAMAAATAAVLVIAGIRLLRGRRGSVLGAAPGSSPDDAGGRDRRRSSGYSGDDSVGGHPPARTAPRQGYSSPQQYRASGGGRADPLRRRGG